MDNEGCQLEKPNPVTKAKKTAVIVDTNGLDEDEDVQGSGCFRRSRSRSKSKEDRNRSKGSVSPRKVGSSISPAPREDQDRSPRRPPAVDRSTKPQKLKPVRIDLVVFGVDWRIRGC